LSLPPCTRAWGTLVHLVTSPRSACLLSLPNVIKPTALLLNILVATIAGFQFFCGGHFSWRLFWPFALLSVPCAFLGGYMLVPAHTFKLVVGCVLLFSAMRLFCRTSGQIKRRITPRRFLSLCQLVQGLAFCRA